MKYPVQLTPDPSGGFCVTFRDIPEAITEGDTEAEAMSAAADALVTAMEFYFEDQRAVPAPSAPLPAERLVSLMPSITAKVLLLNRMIEGRVRPADLARRMGIKPQEVTRIMDLGHATKIDTLAEALQALGAEMQISVA